MAQSIYGPGMDMDAYFAKRALEIQDLRDRKLLKDVAEKLILELYHYTRSEYAALEARVFGELRSVQSDYAIYIGVTDRAHYDAADPFLHPILPADTEAPVYSAAELTECLEQGRPYPLYTVFLEADYRTALEFSKPDRLYQGVVRTENGQYEAKCTVRPDALYLRQIQRLYQIFTANALPWSTVCDAYLHKFFQVELVSVEKICAGETVQEICVDFEAYASQVRYDFLPLWNLMPVSESTSTYPEPCVDRINYDHRIFAHRLDPACQYLVANTDVEITNIRRLEGDLLITCPVENPCQWMLYRVDRPSKQSHTPYPVLSNFSRESFAGNLSDRYRRGVKTKAEISRILTSFCYEQYVTFRDVALEPYIEELSQTYSVDSFILDELRTEQGNTAMVLSFSSPQPDHFLTLDVMSFLVAQVQSIFPEYVCVGKLI